MTGTTKLVRHFHNFNSKVFGIFLNHSQSAFDALPRKSARKSQFNQHCVHFFVKPQSTVLRRCHLTIFLASSLIIYQLLTTSTCSEIRLVRRICMKMDEQKLWAHFCDRQVAYFHLPT